MPSRLPAGRRRYSRFSAACKAGLFGWPVRRLKARLDTSAQIRNSHFRGEAVASSIRVALHLVRLCGCGLRFLIAGLFYLLCFEHVDNLERAASCRRPAFSFHRIASRTTASIVPDPAAVDQTSLISLWMARQAHGAVVLQIHANAGCRQTIGHLSR
jgi:hypothetical protein